MLLIWSVALGLFYGFIFFEFTGLVAGGLVTPGYFAIYFDSPLLIAESIGISLISFTLVRLISTFTILYGRRKFILSVLIGFVIQWSFGSVLWGMSIAETRIDSVGYIIPGLIAHEMDRQGIGKTLLLLLVISCMVRISLHLMGLLKL